MTHPQDAAPPTDTGQICRGTPAFGRTVTALLAAGFSTFAVLYCTQPIMPQLAHDFAVPAAASALPLSLCTAALALALLVAGPLSDAYGRKSFMVGALLISAVLNVLCGLLPGWSTLLVVRTLEGVALAGVPAVAMAYVAEEMHPSAIGMAMGLYISGNAAGGMSGRLVTGVLADLLNWRIALVITGLFAIACALILWRSLPPSANFHPRKMRLAGLPGNFASALREPGLRWLFFTGFLLMGGFVTVYNYLSFRLVAPPYLLSQVSVGLIFSLYVMGIVSSTLAGGLSARFGRARLLTGSYVVMLAGVAATLAGPLWLVICGIALVTFGFFSGHSVASSWVGRRAGGAKGPASALYLLFYYAGSSLAGWLGGLFWARAGWPGVAAFVAVLLVAGLALSLRLAALEEPVARA
jgi:YNFM family putative membrane transporter